MSFYKSWVRYSSILVPKEINNVFDVFEEYGKTWGNAIKNALEEKNRTYKDYRYRPLDVWMKDVEKFVDRVAEAIEKDEFVCVFWDYDADGITATAVMKKWLEYLGLSNVDYIAPNRDTGYSIKPEYIDDYFAYLDAEKIARPTLIITVDCGIKSWADVDYIIQKYNTPETPLDIIITDHHLPPAKEELSKLAYGIIDPHQEDCNYPFPHISGSFVALKCIEALLDCGYKFFKGPSFAMFGNVVNQETTYNELQDIAVVGTIADVMPIVDENKLLAQSTLPRFSVSSNLAIRKWTSAIQSRSYSAIASSDTDIVGFWIGPRINAANRVWQHTTPLAMLLSDNVKEVESLYDLVENLNNQRKLLAGRHKKNSLEYVYANNLHNNNIVIIANPDIPDWVIGLVAWALKEEFGKPAICLWGYKDGVYKWSCRSIEWVHILEDVLQPFKDYLLWFGWHAWAAWFSISEELLPEFIQQVTNYVNAYINIDVNAGTKNTIWEVSNFSLINKQFLETVNLLGPFGRMNEKPIFYVEWEVVSIKAFWDANKNTKLILKDYYNNTIEVLLRATSATFDYTYEELLDIFVPWERAAFIWYFDVNEFRWEETTVLLVDDFIVPN